MKAGLRPSWTTATETKRTDPSGVQAKPGLLGPGLLLRAEAFFLFTLCCFVFHELYPHHWVMFAALFLLPDLSLFGYAVGPGIFPRAVYNAAHTYVLPALLGVVSYVAAKPLLGAICIVWLSHISLDRVLGFGLKYTGAPNYTHMQATSEAG